jgi:hypothetical protein
MSDHEILFTNAAIQNRSFGVDERPGKVVGIMAAQLLNGIVGNTEAIHAWNNVGLFADSETIDAHTRLQNKYDSEVLKQHVGYWGIGEGLRIQTDDDQSFALWAQHVIEGSLKRGIVYIENATFHCCSGCSLVIAEAAVSVSRCSRCGSEELFLSDEDGLFVDTPEDKLSLLAPHDIYNVINIRQEQDSMKQVPPRLLLSRSRSFGVSLECFGLPRRVLDPRLGIGLLALYAADVEGYKKGCLVQSIATLVRTVPYLKSVIVDHDQQQVPKPLFAAHTRIDQDVLMDTELSPVDRNVLLPLASLRRRNTALRGDLQALRAERAKVKARELSISELFERLDLDTVGDVPASKLHESVFLTARMGDLFPVINKVLGKGIADFKRLESTAITEELREMAMWIQAGINHGQAI